MAKPAPEPPKKGDSKNPQKNGPKDAQKGDQKKPLKSNHVSAADAPKDTISQDDIEEEYGLSYALFKAYPELNDLLKNAVAESWTAQKFQVELRQTKWFEHHSDVWRENTALFYSDPSTFDERLGTVQTKLQDLAGSVGATLSQKGLKKLAKRALLFGMSDEELRNALSHHVKPGAQGYTGDLAGIEQDLQKVAYSNGVRIAPDQLQKWMQAIVRGDANSDQYRDNIRNMAAAAFPLYGEQIKGGMDLIDVATPYFQSMSDVLELAPGSIDLNDQTIRTALSGTRDANGKQVPMNTSEFENLLRQDKRWGYTKKANDAALGFASAIGRAWGLI
jgi:hypothetical protein